MSDFVLTKESWINVAEYLETIDLVAKDITEDDKRFLESIELACLAMRYVAEFATDKCIIRKGD